MDDYIVSVLSKMIAIYSITLLFVGSVGNFCGFLVCLKKNIRKIPTFIFTAFSLLCDIVSLYIWNIDHFLYAYYRYQIEELSLEMCRLATFIQIFSLQFSSWLLVFMTFERYLSVRFKRWRSYYFKTKTALITVCVLGVVIFIKNFTMIFFINYDTFKTNITCFASEFFTIYMQENIVLYGLVPYIFMLISNVLLVQCLIFSNKNTTIQTSSESTAKRRAISITVIIVTNLFIVASTPFNIMNAFFLPFLMNVNYGYASLFFCDILAFTYHGLHFAILIVSNKQFSKELRLTLTYLKGQNRIGSLFHDTTQNTVN